MTTQKKIPGLKTLKNRRTDFQDLCNRRGFSGRPVIGKTRELMIDLIMRFVSKKGDFEPGIDDVGDSSRVDAEFVHDEFYLQRRQAIELLLVPFVGLTLTPARLKELCVVVAGRYESLRDAEIVDGWGGDQVVETLLYVHEVKRFPARGRRYYVEFEAFFGIPSGTRWKSELTGGKIQQMIREAGVNRYKRYRDEDLSGLWFIATLQFVNSRLVFHDIRHESSYQNFNRLLMKRRQEVCTGPCAYMRGKTCAPCPVSRDQCPRSRFSSAFDMEGNCRNGHIGLKQQPTDKYCFSCLQNGVFHEEHLGSKRS